MPFEREDHFVSYNCAYVKPGLLLVNRLGLFALVYKDAQNAQNARNARLKTRKTVELPGLDHSIWSILRGENMD